VSPAILTVIQARVGSSRLPGKVMLALGGGTVLGVMLARVVESRLRGRIVVAATTLPEDDAVEAEARRAGVDVFRGHPMDLLDRHREALRRFGGDAVVKIPSDCPLIDPRVIDSVIARYAVLAGTVDYVSNLHPPTHPDGNDVEVVTAGALEIAWREARRGIDREHTTPFLWDHPGKFRLENVIWDKGPDLSKSHRWVLDYPEDYQLVRRVHAELEGVRGADGVCYGMDEILELLTLHPEIHGLNARWRGDSWMAREGGELNQREGVCRS